MRQAMMGWIVIAGCLVLAGIGTVVGAQAMRDREVPVAMIEQWRRYAADVEHGKRTPSAVATRLLTETAIAQNAYASSAVKLLRLMGAAVVLLGGLLGVDLVRHRRRQMKTPQMTPG
jgi:hypothetical protein